jgi:acetyl esterase/lipase
MAVIIALGGTVTLVVLSAASIVPPASMSMLPLSLATSELSPVLAFVILIWIVLARRQLAERTGQRTVATVVLLAAAFVTLRPATQFVTVVHDTAAQMKSEFAAPLRIRRVLRGLPSAGDVQERTVRYAAADGTPLEMRLFFNPHGFSGKRPVVVVLYGGAWRGGAPTQSESVSRALAQKSYFVAAIDYRHAPRFRYPSQLDDVRRSLALLRDSAASWNADTSRIALLGRSAGGHLAELSAYSPGDHPVRAVIAIYAPWNLADGYRDPPVPDPIGTRGVIGNFLGGTPDAIPQRYHDASPSSYVRAGLPATLLIYGARDNIVKPEFNRTAAAALRGAGNHVVQVELPWAEHGFDFVPGGLGSRVAYGTIVAFLDRELSRLPPRR